MAFRNLLVLCNLLPKHPKLTDINTPQCTGINHFAGTSAQTQSPLRKQGNKSRMGRSEMTDDAPARGVMSRIRLCQPR